MLEAPVKQHLIDPEVCIRCNTCEATCPVGAVTHDDNNYVVDAAKCNYCMDCIPPCPTGSIDHWVVVNQPFSLEAQFSWLELPPQPEMGEAEAPDALDVEALRLLDAAHQGAGGHARAPVSAAKPRINLFNRARPAVAIVTGNLRITGAGTESDVRHIILDFGAMGFPVLEGQSIGIVPPGLDERGQTHAMRLYSVASARDGERPNTNNLAITVKRVRERREDGRVFEGIASNYLADLPLGARVEVIGPFGATFLMPDDLDADILMVCTGTGSAPFRGFTERRRRLGQAGRGRLFLYFGARTPEELPYFGPLQRLPDRLIDKQLVFSRVPGQAREYVQDRMRGQAETLGGLLKQEGLHVYICGVRGLEAGVDAALSEIAAGVGLDWAGLRAVMRAAGRFHVETY
ncbi:MAG TPA: benzoyl-CoA 2,3-epoxidase subunit BoxA [Acidiphilium sp.]|nr:MAG: benzoyl-CoA 2,3-epoxidase subunit BoxA [Acidiphilium sp. 21-60-14]OYV89332.1 MAG: benzoyl-CoA 2,3-epoxidase subunit BoxA [Acidiphilium sp. 37-60-79]OZB38296.1 MAG: benzoyl-CoA 2,3-epoxidase subunit BoxA [Acidiphilium sp. 34-60-192]HQT88700.1 benzoyl-CoA 2,3-epoxidase subunit BoxA [Acidiphilium sp.]HQU25080.1 benzoyl-CoA 2,3-epoxidase subunit BoxA [Acidiphilium sp.]